MRGSNTNDANSKSIGSQSTFTIGGSQIFSNFAINATLTVPANVYLPHGWLLNAVQRSEMTFSASSIQSIHISGLAMREVLLSYCENSTQREELLDQAGRPVLGVAGTYSASIPVGNLITSPLGNKAQFPIDGSTISGSITMLVDWNPVGSFCTKIGTGAVVAPTQFDSLRLCVDSTNLQTGAFAMSKTLRDDPRLSYNIPCKYLSSVRRQISVIPDTEQVVDIPLPGAPAGMLTGMCIVVKPNSEYRSAFKEAAGASLHLPIGGSVNIKEIELSFGGQSIFKARNKAQIESNYRGAFSGDTMRYKQLGVLWDSAGLAAANMVQYQSDVCFIPLGYNMAEMYGSHLVENLPSYSGNLLKLEFKIDEIANRTHRAKGEPWTDVPGAGIDPTNAQAYTVEVVWIVSGILEIAQGAIDLAL